MSFSTSLLHIFQIIPPLPTKLQLPLLSRCIKQLQCTSPSLSLAHPLNHRWTVRPPPHSHQEGISTRAQCERAENGLTRFNTSALLRRVLDVVGGVVQRKLLAHSGAATAAAASLIVHTHAKPCTDTCTRTREREREREKENGRWREAGVRRFFPFSRDARMCRGRYLRGPREITSRNSPGPFKCR